MAHPHSKQLPLHRRVWREVVWLAKGWRDREPPDRWNPVFVRELRRGSWRDGLAPRVVILQVFCLLAWFLSDQTGNGLPWALLPLASSLATLLLEARMSAADHRGDAWELFLATGNSRRLWWTGWKRLHLMNLLAALSTLLPWTIVVNLTRTADFEMFLASSVLCLPASSLALRRWTAFGLITTPWKRWTMMAAALLWIEPMMATGWFSVAVLIGFNEHAGLPFVFVSLLAPVLFSFYCAHWAQARISKGNLTPAQESRASLLIFIGCVISMLSVFNAPTLLFFVVMGVNLANRREERHAHAYLPFDENENAKPSVVDETIRTFRI